MFKYASDNPTRWIDVFGLEEGSPSNRRKRAAVAEWAKRQDGSTAYSKENDMGPQYPGGSWKCSKFTCDAAAQAGADTTVSVPDGDGGTVDRCPTAAELARGDVPAWRPLDEGEAPEPGDIAAGAFSDAQPGVTGHAAVVTDDGAGGTTTMGAHADSVGPAGTDRFPGGKPRYRRYTGD